MTFSLRPRRLSTAPLMDGFGQHARGLLEGCRGDEAVGRERGLGDAEQQRTANGRTSSVGDRAVVLFAEAELVDLLFEQEAGVADFLDLHPAEHLPDDGFDVLVGDGHALEAVDFLDFVDQVGLQLLLTEHGENVVRVERSIHQRFAGASGARLPAR